MQEAVDFYQGLANFLQRGIDNTRQRQQQMQTARPQHAPVTLSAEKLIADGDDATMKLFTKFTKMPSFLQEFAFFWNWYGAGSMKNTCPWLIDSGQINIYKEHCHSNNNTSSSSP